MNIDKLYQSVESRGHVCVGLDTCIDYVTPLERQKAQNDAQAVLSFNKAIVDATSDVCACFKVQIAYYEEMGLSGLHAYSETLKYIRNKGCLVIADIKRGDIADTAARYAKAHFSGDFEADFVTLNPYMGIDTIEPWLNYAHGCGKGAFILIRTSNPGMKDFECLNITDNESGVHKRVYRAACDKIRELVSGYKGKYGYGIFGAVIGCTEQEEADVIRKAYPGLFFLIPGYGAQGGSAQNAAVLLNGGNGGVVNASRSIITAWQKKESPDFSEGLTEKKDNSYAAEAAREAVIKMRDEIRTAI